MQNLEKTIANPFLGLKRELSWVVSELPTLRKLVSPLRFCGSLRHGHARKASLEFFLGAGRRAV